MITRRSFGISLAGALLASSALTPAALRAQDASPVAGGALNVGFASDAQTLDPLFSVQSSERQVLYLVFNTLVKFGEDFSILPELAQSWEVAEDGQSITFSLQPGVTFHDGTPFDAEAVRWNIEKRLDEALGSPQREQLEPMIDRIEVIDPLTVKFLLKGAFPSLLSLLGERPGFMVSPTAYEAGNFAANPVGTGPFVFREWVRGSRLVVEKNPAYWEAGKPYLDQIVFQDLAGSVIGVQRLTTGELDFVGDLSPQEVRILEVNDKVLLEPITVGRWYSLQFQVDKPPFNDLRLREAIAYALDREKINNIVMLGRGALSEGPTPPGLWWFDPDLKSRAYDPEKARALLKEAGLEGTSLTLSAPQVTAFQQITQLVQEQLTQVGLTVTLTPVSANDWYARIVDQSVNFSPTRWTQRPDPDGLLYLLFHSKGFQNTTNYNVPEVDELLDRARSSYDQDLRKSLYGQIQERVTADLPMVPLFFSAEYAAMNKSVQNFRWIPDQIPRFREVWLQK